MPFRKVECFDGETGYLDGNLNKKLHTIDLDKLTYLVDFEEDRVYKLVNDFIKSHKAVVVDIKDSEIIRRTIFEYMKLYSRLGKEELNEYLDSIGMK